MVIFLIPVLNYFDCVRVFEAVKEVDGDSKSLFGQYTSPRVKVHVLGTNMEEQIVLQCHVCATLWNSVYALKQAKLDAQ